jgi:hypothetical protein
MVLSKEPEETLGFDCTAATPLPSEIVTSTKAYDCTLTPDFALRALLDRKVASNYIQPRS